MKVRTILILSANPSGSPLKRLDQEVREIKAGLRRSEYRNNFDIKQAEAVTVRELQRAFLEYKPHIVHFCGHGEDGSGILLEDKQGKPHVVSVEALSDLFELFANQVECVLLNACYSENQAKGIAQHIQSVIGMHQVIGDAAAIDYAVSFYDALGAGRTVSFSHRLACNAIKLIGVMDQLNPILLQSVTAEKSSKDTDFNYYPNTSSRVNQLTVSSQVNKDIDSKTVQDWGDAPDVSEFYGREEELKTLRKWVIQDRCRLVLITGFQGIGKTNLSIRLGKGGIGKTDLSVKLAEGLQNNFQYIVWRSLLNAPSITSLLTDVIKVISDQRDITVQDSTKSQISQLLNHFRDKRCLLILDNTETILQGGSYAGQYREGYEDYQFLFKKIAEVSHQSCLLLTSRERPYGLGRVGKKRPVQILQVKGLAYSDAKYLFGNPNDYDLSDKVWEKLIKFYDGNPLALELAANHIDEVFFGDIERFLKEGKQIFGDLKDLLSWHFSRLSKAEKEIIYWLGIHRESVSISKLEKDILSIKKRQNITSNLQSLCRKLPIETNSIGFTLQPVLIEYVTEVLIEIFHQEIVDERYEILSSHSIINALEKDYIRDTQIRLILNPLYERLISTLRKPKKISDKFNKILYRSRGERQGIPDYIAGNILNFVVQTEIDPATVNFSHSYITRGYLQGAHLYNVDLSYCHIEQTIFTQTFSSILSVSLHKNGNLLATGDVNAQVRIWRIEDGQPLAVYKGHNDWVRDVKFSPDGQLIASSSDDRTIKIWDLTTGESIKTLKGHTDWVWSISFSKNGKMIATGSTDGSIIVWDVATGRRIASLKEETNHINHVWSVCFGSSNDILASGHEDSKVRIWDIERGSILKRLEGHTKRVRSVVFGNDGDLLISGGDDKLIFTWDTRNGALLNKFEGNEDWVWSIILTPDDHFAISGSNDGVIKIWDIKQAKCINTLTGHLSWIRSLDVSVDGEIMASGSGDQTVKVWSINDGSCIAKIHGYTNEIMSAVFSADGKDIASGHADCSIRIWNIYESHFMTVLEGHKEWVWDVSFSPNNKILASCSNDKTVKLWNLKSKECIFTLQGHTNTVWCVSFSPDNKFVASGCEDQTIRIWNAANGSCVRIIGDKQDIIGWVLSVDFSPNGTYLVSAHNDNIVRVWDPYTGKCIQIFEGHTDRVWSVTFSPDSQFIVTGSDDKTIRLWSINNENCLFTLRGHNGNVRSVKFSPDGKFIASASEDSSVKIWDIKLIDCIKTMQGHTAWVRTVDFSPDGTMIATSSEDETIKIWDVDTGNVRKTIRPKRPYEGMNISGVTGLTPVQKHIMQSLGAIENL